MQAAKRFAADEDNAAVAKALRVHVRPVQRWRAAWEIGGEAALVSKGPPNHPQLSEAQFAILEAELERGPVAHGWPDQPRQVADIVDIGSVAGRAAFGMSAVYCATKSTSNGSKPGSPGFRGARQRRRSGGETPQ